MKLAVVTPSYHRDFARCQLLCRSLDRFLDPQIEHILIVENRDLALFRPLRGPRRRILVVQDIIPNWMIRTPLSRSWWLSLKTLPIRNWNMQQIVKLSIGDAVEADGCVFMDSDMFLVKPLGPDVFVKDGKLALFRVPGCFEAVKPWHRAAAVLLGLPPADFFGANYVGQMIPWRRDNLRKLLHHVESTTGAPWARAIARTPRFSEYTLYGVFVDHVLAGESGHFPDDRPLCESIWQGPWGSEQDIQTFFAKLGLTQVAGMISSRIGVPAGAYEKHWLAHANRSD